MVLNFSNSSNLEQLALKGLICCTHQHYHRLWLPNNDWSNFSRRDWGRDWEKNGFLSPPHRTATSWNTLRYVLPQVKHTNALNSQNSHFDLHDFRKTTTICYLLSRKMQKNTRKLEKIRRLTESTIDCNTASNYIRNNGALNKTGRNRSLGRCIKN